MRENCLNCHNPHGSNHDKLLVSQQPWLCQRCHLNTRHPGTLYSNINTGRQRPRRQQPGGGARLQELPPERPRRQRAQRAVPRTIRREAMKRNGVFLALAPRGPGPPCPRPGEDFTRADGHPRRPPEGLRHRLLEVPRVPRHPAGPCGPGVSLRRQEGELQVQLRWAGTSPRRTSGTSGLVENGTVRISASYLGDPPQLRQRRQEHP